MESSVQCVVRMIDSVRAVNELLVTAFLNLVPAYPSQNQCVVGFGGKPHLIEDIRLFVSLVN